MGRVLGLDVGDRRIGLALSDALRLTAQPLGVLERKSPAQDLAAIASLIDTHGAEAVVAGLPLNLRGEQGPQAQKVAAFVDALRQRVAVPVHVVDERLTTVQGERMLREVGASRVKRKQVIDRVAAQLILQQFLDAQRPAGT